MAKTKKEVIKTLKDLSIINKDIADINKIISETDKGNTKVLEKTLAALLKMKSTEVDRAKIVEEITQELEKHHKTLKEISGKDQKEYNEALKLTKKAHVEINDQQSRYNKQLESSKKLLADVGKAFDYLVKQNQEIYKTSHEMQLQGNITWREFTKLYNEAYSAARDLNTEIGKQLYTARELIVTQEKLIGSGWRDIDISTFTNITASMALLQRTLGDLDQRLTNAFQISYRQFGSQTDQFITQMGNSLNAFSDTFGMTVGMLQGAVASIVNVNTLIARNNLDAQIRANESFMQAAALSTSMGLTSVDFLGTLLRTSEFGTASELADLYSAGAFLTGFDTTSFIDAMSSGQAYEGTRDLISSVYTTLTELQDNPLLRNEYMKMIQQGFGFSQDDLINIMNTGGDFAEYDKEVQDKLLNVNNSMVDELKDLKMTIVDQLENFWANSKISEGLGQLFNEFGLYGTNDHLKTITTLLTVITGKQLISGIAGIGTASGGTVGSAIGSWLTTPQTLSGLGVSATGAARLGTGALGLAGGIGANALGRNIITGNVGDYVSHDIGGGALNILGGMGGGALTGAMIGGLPGAIIGGVVGVVGGAINTWSALEEKKNAIYELDAQDRERRAAEKQAPVQTGDPVLDAINNVGSSIVNAITGEGDATRRMQFNLDLIDKGSTKGSIVAK